MFEDKDEGEEDDDWVIEAFLGRGKGDEVRRLKEELEGKEVRPCIFYSVLLKMSCTFCTARRVAAAAAAAAADRWPRTLSYGDADGVPSILFSTLARPRQVRLLVRQQHPSQ